MAAVAAEDLDFLSQHLHLLAPEEMKMVERLLNQRKTGIVNHYITERHIPTPKQEMFLTCDDLEVLYGGSAGGGKSIALWMGALQYVTEPNYDALILRRTFTQLIKPGALMDVAREWMSPWLATGEVKYDPKATAYRFPSGATVSFGYLDSENDKYNYQGPAYNYVAFDEGTQFTETQYAYLFSRIRRTVDNAIPPRMRMASNPGGDGHEWVKSRFIPEAYSFCPTCNMHIDRERDCCNAAQLTRFKKIWYKEGKTFIPANLLDNPYLDVNSYRLSLANLGAAVREQLEYGDWDVLEQGDYFRTEWFRYYTTRGDTFLLPNRDLPGEQIVVFPQDVEYFVTADTASSQKADSAYTVLCVWALDIKRFNLLLIDVVRSKFLVPDIAPQIHQLVQRYNAKFAMIEAKDSGMGVIQQLRNKQGLTIRDFQPSSHKGYNGACDKISRSTVAQNRMEGGQVWFPRTASFLHAFQSELLAFPTGEYADQVDNMSMAAIYADERAKHIGGATRPQPQNVQRPVFGGIRFPGGFR